MSGLAATPFAAAAAPPSHGEVIPANEPAATRAILAIVEAKLREAAKTGPARRDAHPKAHGCVRATFRVLDGLPDTLRVGVFAEPREFQAWIRFSNGSPVPQPDTKGDARGMAIKLMDVAGSASGTQDFVLISAPVFIVRHAADYLDLETAPAFWRFFIPGLNPLRFRLHEARNAFAILRSATANLLNIRYWSMSPYRCGEIACKYGARPVGSASSRGATSQPDYLRDNLRADLAEREAAFDFMIQSRGDPATMPIEDPTILWDETLAPFIPVARIAIPVQTFDDPADLAFCEALSFTPWHCLDVHRPLGGINRLRRAVYDLVSSLRHAINRTERREPTG